MRSARLLRLSLSTASSIVSSLYTHLQHDLNCWPLLGVGRRLPLIIGAFGMAACLAVEVSSCEHYLNP
jgi:hypothetical protein